MSDAAPSTASASASVSDTKKGGDAATAQWSAWYEERNDDFAEFASFDPSSAAAASAGMGAASASTDGFTRRMSSRQISGMVEGEKAADDRWAEDWNDEDAEDTFDRIAEKCGLTQHGASVQQN